VQHATSHGTEQTIYCVQCATGCAANGIESPTRNTSYGIESSSGDPAHRIENTSGGTADRVQCATCHAAQGIESASGDSANGIENTSSNSANHVGRTLRDAADQVDRSLHEGECLNEIVHGELGCGSEAAGNLADGIDRVEPSSLDSRYDVCRTGRKLVHDIVTDGLGVGDESGDIQAENEPSQGFSPRNDPNGSLLDDDRLAGKATSLLEELVGNEGLLFIAWLGQAIRTLADIDETALANAVTSADVADMGLVLLGCVEEQVADLGFARSVVDIDDHGSGICIEKPAL